MTSLPAYDVLVVGGGQAGGRLVESLRLNGYLGSIGLIGAESWLPYERPALSKEVLSHGNMSKVTWVQGAAFYEHHDIELLLGAEATCIDRQNRTVRLNDGRAVTYGHLVLATGARPREIEVAPEVAHLCRSIRTIEDSLFVAQQLAAPARIVVVGAGLIGLEVAAVARDRGCEVTVLGSGNLPLSRCSPPDVGRYFAHLHAKRGVRLELGQRVTAVSARNRLVNVWTATVEENQLNPTGKPGGPISVECSGRSWVADFVVLAIGIVPNCDLAAACGLEIDDGIVTDGECRTSDPRIFAVGDVVCRPLVAGVKPVRQETWRNAHDTALIAAAVIMGKAVPASVPWFWSDQFDRNLQVYGHPQPDDHRIERGEFGRPGGLIFYVRNGAIVGVAGVNAGRDLRVAKEMLVSGSKVLPMELRNTAEDLRTIFRRMC